jgi:hypothetical protein
MPVEHMVILRGSARLLTVPNSLSHGPEGLSKQNHQIQVNSWMIS